MMLSIYGTVFNNADRIEESVDSLLRVVSDASVDYEIVIVDNVSTDGTTQILEQMSKRDSAIHFSSRRCTRGAGRAIAVTRSKGEYVMHADLDSVYDRILAKVVKLVVESRRDKKDVIDNIMSRENLVRHGNWKDLNASEDIELYSRLLRNGSKLYSVPAHWFSNQARKVRENMYAASKLSSSRRKFNLYVDKIRGMGIMNLQMVNSNGKVRKASNLGLIYYCKLVRKEIYKNSNDTINNFDYLARNRIFITPSEFGIGKDKWVYHFSKKSFNSETVRIMTENIRKAGLDKLNVVNESWVVLHTAETASRVLKDVNNYAAVSVRQG